MEKQRMILKECGQKGTAERAQIIANAFILHSNSWTQ